MSQMVKMYRRSQAGWRVGRFAGLMLPLVAVILAGLSGGRAAAAVIIAEDFNRPDDTAMAGTTPDQADLPGGIFTVSTDGWTAQALADQLQFGADISLNAPLGSFDTGLLALSADISLGNLAGSLSPANRGVGLGLNTASDAPSNSFTGLRLTPDGYLVFQSNSVNLAEAYVGAGTGFMELSYDVNMNTGLLSGISLQGSNADLSSLVTASADQNYFSSDSYASVLAGGSSGGQYGYVDNLVVANAAPVAEPASLLVLASPLAGLALIRRRRSPA